jgi:CRP-like cAMP-binding protein
MLEAWTLGATSGDKPPKFRIRRLDGAGVAYKIVYLIDPRKKPKGPARHALLSCLHRHLRYAGLRPVMSEMAASGLPPRPQRFLDMGSAADRRLVIDQVGLLSALTAGERARLAEGVRVSRVATGTAVVQQGAGGHSMYLLAVGVLDVRVLAAGAAESQRSGVLSPGDFFGEMSLLTGSPRTATVTALCPSLLFEVPFELMATLLDARPALAEGLSQVVAEHLRRDAAAQAPEAAPPPPEPSFTQALAARIRNFFASRAAL